MVWKQRLFTNMFLRNMLADLGDRSSSSNNSGNVTPYFQYKIGSYQPDYFLYFPKEPFAKRYKNEVFNKLQEYSGYDLIKYLEFHFAAYGDKPDFLKFLWYEISERLIPAGNHLFSRKLQYALEWVKEKKQELGHRPKTRSKGGSADLGMNEGVIDNDAEADPNLGEYTVQALSKKLTDCVEQIMATTEQRMESLTGAFVTGHIELNNQNHLEKLIQVLSLLQTVQAPPKIARAEQLFKKFSATDMASILHLHFEAFRNKRINTLQVKIREATEMLNPVNPKVQKLSTALQDFFY